MTDYLLCGLCFGQGVIAALLLFVFTTNWDIHKRLEKTQLSVQGLCDRVWERMWRDGGTGAEPHEGKVPNV